MILNEQQYQFTKQRLAEFNGAFTMVNSVENQKQNSDFKQLNSEALTSLIEDFTAQIKEYEDLVNRRENTPLVFPLANLQELPQILIKARIASHITQSELADYLGMDIAHFQKLEEREYETANLSLLWNICSFLGITITSDTPIFLTQPQKQTA